ncbi:hypothetical protein [Kitasatospora sp. NPDC018619]|uniref:hypothetical protein n=1 Tax=unclassified Kitasatospora TaxID=2633591 RepID=UPI0037890254
MTTERPAASDRSTATEPATPPAGPAVGLGLGPMLKVDGTWYIGDHESRACLAVLPEGFEHRVAGRDPFLVPWHRLMSLELGVTSSRFLSSPVGGLVAGRHEPAIGTHGSCLRAMVRHPYDLWSPRFVHHRWWYPAPEVTLLHQLLGAIVDLGRVHRLGDDAWLTATVELLATDRFLRRWRTSKAVADGVRDIVVREA